VQPVKPLGDKVARASPVSPLVESGRVYLPEAAPWLAEFMDEVSSFPAAPHDYQVDVFTSFRLSGSSRARSRCSRCRSPNTPRSRRRRHRQRHLPWRQRRNRREDCRHADRFVNGMLSAMQSAEQRAKCACTKP
jgi:terminase large subunit-like protein